MSNKKGLGQYYTTNYDYILQNISIPSFVKTIIEPFAGQGDLLKFIDCSNNITLSNSNYNINHRKKYTLECYDIDPKQSFIKKRDTLQNPPDYRDKFVLTNPPYLARNKSKDKILFDQYDANDLYKCFIKSILLDPCLGGILIIPLNFWCSIRLSDITLRKNFTNVYHVHQLNIFEERVFSDTSYTICSFLFIHKSVCNTHFSCNYNYTIPVTMYPFQKTINVLLDKHNLYTIGGDIYRLHSINNLYNGKYKITRVTQNNESQLNTNLMVKCIDDSSSNKIQMQYYTDSNALFVDRTPNLTARTYVTLIITPTLNIKQQHQLVLCFNKLLNSYRDKYHSLFLNNYRESNAGMARKRITFDLVYSLVDYCLQVYVPL